MMTMMTCMIFRLYVNYIDRFLEISYIMLVLKDVVIK